MPNLLFATKKKRIGNPVVRAADLPVNVDLA